MSRQSVKFLIFLGAVIVVFLPFSILLTSCQPLDTQGIVDDLLPNLWVFLTHIFACVFLLIIIMWLAWKPTKTYLAKRRAYIANEIAEAEKSRREAFIKLNEAEQTRIQAHAQAKIIVDNATNQAYAQKETIENESKINAKKIIEDAKQQSLKLEKKLREDNEKQVLDIAFSATEALLQKNFDKSDNDKIVQEFIDKLAKKQVKTK
ncbi:MAG: F0F1 ATP synthase subunit B [Mycoplasmataceae bacterium]|nr:F0F1 ATP synthase subunit B [Mycoplasmataceae bacterium]